LKRDFDYTLRLWQFADFQADAMCFSLLRCTLAGVALIDKSDCRRLRPLLPVYGLRQLSARRAVLCRCRRHMQRQQVPKRGNSDVNFAALAPLRSVISRTRVRFRRRLQGAAVEDGGTWLRVAPCGDAQQHAQVMDDSFKGELST
jgi:hypothetical protein